MSCGPISSPDTMAAMLLCARLGKASEQKVKPLSLGEYNRFAAWLKDNSLRPSSLLTQDGIFHVRNYRDSSLEPDRLEALLKRGGSLAFHLEKWGQAGIWVIGRGETEYPQLLKKRLRTNAAPFIFGVGNRGLLNIGGVCIVGSRDVSAGGIDFARQVGRACAADRIPVISGNAKGADSESMISSYNAIGAVIGVLAENLLKTAPNGKYRDPLQSGRMVCSLPFLPNAFSIGNAWQDKILWIPLAGCESDEVSGKALTSMRVPFRQNIQG